MKSKPSTPKTKTSAPQRFERRKTGGGGSALANRKAAVNKVMKDVLEAEVMPRSAPKTRVSRSQSARTTRTLTPNAVIKDVLETEALSSRKPVRPRKLAMGGVAKIRLGESTASGRPKPLSKRPQK
ncbi:hypothetical protein Bealeia2_02084 (plasmid) [Candidatus Bealeia paramacronuclearis]|uniref:hypothetical protein n=1 Tax=Candidatus Bealeia paramacronuclearis TaxID=1921001 RepID=UPI002CA1421E|nr:hypothetical protein [Candidatus Bealeia paramacronuclearis]MEB3703388.1 hypothetical protein [Candidatus Bealeia paramacronuclearis]